MGDPRGNVLAIADAAIDNGVLAAREGWGVNPAYYDSPTDADLVVDVASFQEDTRAGRFPGVEALVIDGRLGPKTKQAIKQVSSNAGVEAGFVGAQDWPEWWASALTFTAKPRIVPTPEPGIMPEVLIPDPPAPAPAPAQSGSGGGGLVKVAAAAIIIWGLLG
jgi:peptidoglycan hydrolase-like protein with peptidoglycan-binding domain